MLKRLVAVATLALLWVPLYLVVNGRESTEPYDTRWVRENYYYNYANYQRMGSGPDLHGQARHVVHTNPDRVRVLVVGDSYTYGYGAADLDLRWAERLELELEQRSGPGSFEVVTLAKGGSTTADQASWLEQTDIDYDLLVVGYVWNDILPGRIERIGFRDCPTLGDGTSERIPYVPGEQVGFHCTLERLQGGALEDVPGALHRDDPRRRDLTAAVDRIRIRAGERPAVVMQLLTREIEAEVQAPAMKIFNDAGFLIAPVEELLETIRTTPPADLMVNPADPHPGSVLTAAYARIAAETVLNLIPAERLAVARNGVAPITDLVSNHLPYTLDVRTDGGAGGDIVRVIHRGDEPEAGVPYFDNGKPFSLQFAPCQALGHPYAQIALSPRTGEGTTVTVTLVTSTAAELALWSFGYDREHRPTYTRLGDLRTGQTRSLVVTGDARGILLADTTAGCSTTTPIALPRFELRLERAGR